MKVSAARLSDIPEIAALLGEVFTLDPTMRDYVKASRDPERTLRGMFSALLRHFYVPFGAVDMVRSADGELLGAALWRPSGASMNWKTYVALARALGRSLPRAWRNSRREGSVTPRFPHWYLLVIATAPAARGQGVGGVLLDHGIDRAGSEAIYLESTGPRSRALYERKGFQVLGKIPQAGGAPSEEVGMWRPGAW